MEDNQVKKPTKPVLKHKDSNTNNENPGLTTKRSVVWDTQQLEELEEERIKNPKMKINEPKTPYIHIVINI
jgi:hypothetical protein